MNIFIIFLVSCLVSFATTCTVTTVSGTHAPSVFCSGDLIFEDNFHTLDQARWRHERTLAGGGNWEFQWYDNDRNNSFVNNGFLNIRPTLTSDIHGEAFLTSGRFQIPPGECTTSEFYGCDRQGTPDNIINPIRSARLDTWNSFRFRFGTLEIRAKNPAGDWIWPALWLMPRFSVYGGWPASGEWSDTRWKSTNGKYNALWTTTGCEINGWQTAHYVRNRLPNFSDDFHVYRMVWTPSGITFFIDGVTLGVINAGQGFWARGGFAGSGLPNSWLSGTIMAPFDQEFFIIINNAVGGVNFFADSFVNQNGGKPWLNTSPHAARDFWNGRSQWQSSWIMGISDSSNFQVDYVRVWAI